MISINYKGHIYNIEQQPFETIEDSYKRAWFIIKNYNKYKKEELYSQSIMMLNIKKGMIYS